MLHQPKSCLPFHASSVALSTPGLSQFANASRDCGRPAGNAATWNAAVDLLIRFEGMCHGWIVLKSFEINQMFKQVHMGINHMNIQQIVLMATQKYHKKKHLLCCFKWHVSKGQHSFTDSTDVTFAQRLGIAWEKKNTNHSKQELDLHQIPSSHRPEPRYCFPQAIPKNIGTIFAPVQ